MTPVMHALAQLAGWLGMLVLLAVGLAAILVALAHRSRPVEPDWDGRDEY